MRQISSKSRLRGRGRLFSGLYLLVGAAAIVAYYRLGSRPGLQTALYDLLGATSVVAIATAIHLRRVRGVAWWAFAGGVALFAAGDLAYSLPVPSLTSDGLYISGYALFGAALVGLSIAAGDRQPAMRRIQDFGVLFLAGLAPLWFFAIDNSILASSTFTERLLTITYPTLDLALLVLLARFWFAGTWRSPAYGLLLLAFGVMLGADIAWRELLAQGGYSDTSWTSGAYLTAYVLWGCAALHPSMRTLGSQRTARLSERRASDNWLLLLAVGSVAPAIVIYLKHGNLGGEDEVFLFTMIAAVLPLLILAGVRGLIRELRKVADEAVRTRHEVEAILDASPLPITVVDPGGIVRLWNRAAEHTSGLTAAEVIGSTPPIFPLTELDGIASLYRDVLQGEKLRGVDVRLQNRDQQVFDARVWSAPLPSAPGDRPSAVAIFEDVTEERRRSEQIRYLADHDALTGLPNRRSFEDALERLLARPEGSGSATLLLIDIDNFKSVNDAGGHMVGDRVLVELPGVLKVVLRASDLLARLSGDEFAIILDDADESVAGRIGGRILDAAREFRLVSDRGVFDATISAGVYTIRSGDTAQDVFVRADEALYEAKARGKNRLVHWRTQTPNLGSLARSWSPTIKDALRERRFEAFAQPIVDLATGTVVHQEILCRMRSSSGELIMPAAFLDHAETLGLMPSIDRQMLDRAYELLTSDKQLSVFINLSPASFEDDVLFAELERKLELVAPHRLGIEITEHTSLRDLVGTNKRLMRLRDRGCLVAIDDFGVGFTSFSQLATLDCDIVKISGSFTREAAEGEATSRAIVEAITAVAHAHGKTVVGEGIETITAAALARSLGIEWGQGWYFGRPERCADGPALTTASPGGAPEAATGVGAHGVTVA